MLAAAGFKHALFLLLLFIASSFSAAPSADRDKRRRDACVREESGPFNLLPQQRDHRHPQRQHLPPRVRAAHAVAIRQRAAAVAPALEPQGGERAEGVSGLFGCGKGQQWDGWNICVGRIRSCRGGVCCGRGRAFVSVCIRR